ncbi:MAG: porphobilinogen synthase [Candidatus Omnitrophica bacterium]|nr:porphobilinogen synthase [Candidatus Omnitrophota bacterium]MBU4590350.1 porphobilinogen synthase [Candidatus Omnitrophota bacterium]
MPVNRLRRLRRNSAIRDWVSETVLRPKDLILPYFVIDGKGVDRPIKSLPEVSHLSIDKLLKEIAKVEKRGIRSILLFGVPKKKDKIGSEAYNKDGIVQRATKAIKKEFEDLVVITDVCLCSYTSHGHCGIIKGQGTPYHKGTEQASDKRQGYIIDNDKTLKILAKIALSHAEAGADLVAPSAMMDGQVMSIREGLDKNGFKDIGIMAYAAKYASNFYGPFREALDSGPHFGDRKTYQMDFRNSDQALREIGHDIEEGADIVMVKPALSYLDIIYRAKEKFNVPVAAYNVSGEYAMVKAYSQGQGIEKELALEILTSIKRAGADFIITYWAKEAAGWLN